MHSPLRIKIFHQTTLWVLFLFFQFLQVCFSQLNASETEKIKITSGLKVSDGDSFEVNHVKWRLWGIDAPELYQTCHLKLNKEEVQCGLEAKRKLESLMILPIECEIKSTDRYQRRLGYCLNSENQNINAEMVKSGFAFDYRRYSDFHFDAEEKLAKKEAHGLWQTDFLWPWHWRQKNQRK